MIDRVSEVVRCYRMEINVEEANVMISMEILPVQLKIDQTQLEKVAYLTYLCTLIINNARYTQEIKSRTAMARAAFKKKTTLFNTNWTEFKEKACDMLIWNTAMYGAETYDTS